MQKVLVVDKNKKPLMPTSPARARQLLRSGKAAVLRRYPFTIILKNREGGDTQSIAFKIDPGSRVTGLALVADFKRGQRVIWAAELTHRGQQIRDKLLSRRQIRRSRRNRKCRSRPARFDNRRKPEGWLPPSLRSRVDNIITWGVRLYRFCPVARISLELVRFDTQLMENPDVSGVEYQQGELWGYEVREYLLEKWGRKCAYCGAENVPLENEHIVPKSRGGSNRISNLTLACNPCNIAKGNQTAAEFGHPEVQTKAKPPLKDAAAINATRWARWRELAAMGLPIECGTGGRTKYNRIRQNYPKAHWIDAACVGESGETVFIAPNHAALGIRASGWGCRRAQNCDQYGFPRGKARQIKQVRGFQTGDLARAIVPNGKKAGTHSGRIAVRASGSFRVGTIDGISWKYCRIIHRMDGYDYGQATETGALSTG